MASKSSRQRKLQRQRKNTKRQLETLQEALFKREKYLSMVTPELRNTIPFLAHESILVDLFARRIHRQTGKNILLVGIGGTGKPYTYATNLFQTPGISTAELNYPSTKHRDYTKFHEKTIELLNKTPQNTIIIFVDSSKDRRMPSALIGYNPSGGYTPKKDSLSYFLNQNNFSVFQANYNYSRRRNEQKRADKLPNYDQLKPTRVTFNPFSFITNLFNKKRIAILLNPSKERKIRKDYDENKYFWGPAMHDDGLNQYNEIKFKKLVEEQIIKTRQSMERFGK